MTPGPMTPDTVEPRQARPASDQERALLFAQEFGLGTLARASRSRELPKPAAWGGLLAIVLAIFGLPVVSVLPAKAVTAVVVGALFAACCALSGVAVARSPVTTRLYRYSGGLAQLAGDEPEPRVARWADVRDFTVHYFEADDAAPRLSDFTLTTVTGTTLPGLRGFRFRREARAVAADAERILAPRLVPAMTAAYESGAAVSFGRVQVSRAGIAVSGWGSPGEPVPWRRVKSVHVTYILKKDGDYAHEVIVGGEGLPTTEISVSGLPNGIFLPRLIAFAAAREGTMVTGYRKDGGGIPAG